MGRFERTIPTTIHGHYWVRPAEVSTAGAPTPLVIGFHGYGETAEDHLEALESIPGSEGWHLAAVQALHPFYTRSGRVVASWMTRFDRELAIADNTAYAAAATEAIRRDVEVAAGRAVFAGFSQGVAMAYRAAAVVPCAGLVVLAGDVPPDVDERALPPVLLGRGAQDDWYDHAKMAADLTRLEAARIEVERCVFDGGHVWGRQFQEAAGRFVSRLAASGTSTDRS